MQFVVDKAQGAADIGVRLWNPPPMPHADFVHLRVHSPYSLSEGAVRIKDMVKLCRGLGMPAIAITDTDNLFGALEFSKTLSAEGIQPIIGCQIGLRPEAETPRVNGRQESRAPSVVLLAKSEEGYRNILKLLRMAYLDTGEAEEPHVTLEQVCALNGGLILLTGGAGGPVGQLLAAGRKDDAEALFVRLLKVFEDRIYVELQRHGMDVERATEGGFLELAYAHGVPLVATNEAFFPTRGMYEAHDVLICIAEGTYVAQAGRRRLTPEHYLKSPAEMRALFADLPEALDNTLVIAKRCAYMVRSINPLLPPYDCGEGMNEEATLRQRAEQGLEKRLATIVLGPGMTETEQADVRKRYSERLQYELGVIVQMGFAGYFLIVSDFISWAKAHGIPVGPGRGSGAGSLVAWSLTITDLDPIRWGLLFERFLNPERVSMPDFDIDFCQERRDEVIAYVQHKYGRDKVAQIITFGKLQARAVLRDVGRVLGMPYSQVDRICKLVPNNPAKPVTLEQAIDSEPQLRAMIEGDEAVARLVELAKPLEGLYRHASTHAAGVVIGDRPLEQLVPLYRDPKNPMPVSGFNMKYVESAGLVKFDFLGLKTLTVLAKALQYIKEPLDLSALPLDDRATYEMLGRGETTGVFQLESAGMRDVLRKLKPDTFEDIIAVVALYRPGPMDNIPSYIKRKHGEEEPDYLYPSLEWILKETFGIIIYQEQVMQIAQELSGYTLGGADLLRRAMGKKIKEEMDKQRQIFVDGAVGRNVAKDKASEIFDLVAKFAGYGFNKSHAAAYALVAYQTAYLKANYPAEFMAALMTLDMGNTEIGRASCRERV
jgi:DNA polymerase-3 subunit alpha